MKPDAVMTAAAMVSCDECRAAIPPTNTCSVAGEINLPYAWQPAVVEISILRAGQLVILAVPGEFTTMAGRRLRRAVHDAVRCQANERHVAMPPMIMYQYRCSDVYN